MNGRIVLGRFGICGAVGSAMRAGEGNLSGRKVLAPGKVLQTRGNREVCPMLMKRGFVYTIAVPGPRPSPRPGIHFPHEEGSHEYEYGRFG